jgi:hypothetical protein
MNANKYQYSDNLGRATSLNPSEYGVHLELLLTIRKKAAKDILNEVDTEANKITVDHINNELIKILGITKP